ncbi:hypothetical protein B0H14DRAFT_2608269 [Mycena olivaceomarginata]|nr:hypothetical protein B0H14DRAFT_2608269 [Mycena olivaceomarginata]
MRPGTPAFHPAKLNQESSDAEADTYLFSNAVKTQTSKPPLVVYFLFFLQCAEQAIFSVFIESDRIELMVQYTIFLTFLFSLQFSVAFQVNELCVINLDACDLGTALECFKGLVEVLGTTLKPFEGFVCGAHVKSLQQGSTRDPDQEPSHMEKREDTDFITFWESSQKVLELSTWLGSGWRILDFSKDIFDIGEVRG